MHYRIHRPQLRRGVAMLEFAVVAPVLFLLMFAVIEYGRFLMIRQLLDNAAREGARMAAANAPFKYDTTQAKWVAQTLTTSDIQNQVITYLAGQTLKNSSGTTFTGSDISIYRADPSTGLAMTDTKGSAWTSASFGEAIAVKISVKYQTLFPAYKFLQNPDPISFICIMRSEAVGH